MGSMFETWREWTGIKQLLQQEIWSIFLLFKNVEKVDPHLKID